MVLKQFARVALGLTTFGVLISLFQNCSPQFQVQGDSLASVSGNSVSLSLSCVMQDGSKLEPGNSIQGYPMSSALFPMTCGQQVTRTCLNTGQFDGSIPLFNSCGQQCVHPENSQAVSSGSTYVYYSKSSGVSQADCDAARITSTCQQNTGTFLPQVPAQKFGSCLVQGQTCAYTSSAGTATPTGNMLGSTVTGFVTQSATYPTLCGQQVTRTCAANGTWGGSVPVYSSCAQKCVHPDTNQPVDFNSPYVYYTLAQGSATQCAAARVSSTCQATGLFAPNPAGVTKFAACTVFPLPTISLTATPNNVRANEVVTLSWVATNAVSLTLNPGNMNVTGRTNALVNPAASTTYTITATNPAGSAASSASVTINAQPVLLGSELYNMTCVQCHGALETSQKIGATSARINDALANQPAMQALKGSLSQVQVDSLVTVLTRTTPGTGGRLTYTCNPNQVPSSNILKLTNREFKSSLNLLLDDFATTLKNDSNLVSLLNGLPSDTLREVNFNKEQYFLLTNSMLSAYFDSAFRASSLIVSSTTGLQNYPNTNRCLAAAAITQACHQSFVKEFGSKAFRRPLATAEVTAVSNQFWDGSLSKNDLIQLTVTGILQAPDFMYRIYDQGATSNRGARVLNLTAHEFAAKMSFLLTGAPPDSTLKSLADAGTLLDPAVAGAQIDRLLASSSASSMWIRFYRESLGYDYFSTFTYSAAFLEGQSTTNLQSAMTAEMDNFFVDIVQKQNGSFRDTMKSTRSTVNSPALAQLYGVTNSAAVINLPAQRTGFLNRAAFLAKRSGTVTSPVKRGQEVLEAVLCGVVGSPPAGVSTTLDPVPSGQYITTRARYAAKTEIPGTSCVACHTRMNNLGYPYEMFDSLGRHRTQEKIFDTATGLFATTLALDTQATTNELSANPINLKDAVDLNEQLSNNDIAMMCFAKKFKEFESRKPASAADNCQMNKTLSTLYSDNINQGSIQSAIKQFILSDDFKNWSY